MITVGITRSERVNEFLSAFFDYFNIYPNILYASFRLKKKIYTPIFQLNKLEL